MFGTFHKMYFRCKPVSLLNNVDVTKEDNSVVTNIKIISLDQNPLTKLLLNSMKNYSYL